MADQQIVIKRDADGKRYVQPYLGISKYTGRQIRPYRSFPDSMTDEEVMAAARTWLFSVGAAQEMGVTTKVGELLKTYIDLAEALQKADNTVRSYRHWAADYLTPLHDLYAREVTHQRVQNLYRDLLTKGGKGGKPLAASTVRSVQGFLHGFFTWLVKSEVCETNPCDDQKMPTLDLMEAGALDRDGIIVLTNALRDEMAVEASTREGMMRRCTAFLAYLALTNGLRVGEACALRRCDVTMTNGLHVNATVTEVHGVRRAPRTKGKRSRNVSLNKDVAEQIRAHVAWEDRALGREAFAEWRNRSKMPLATVDGRWLRPTAVSREFRRIARDYGLPEEVRFHTLRHSHATWLILGGKDMRTVQERLGHARIDTTMRIYAHVLPGRDQDAADGFMATVQELVQES